MKITDIKTGLSLQLFPDTQIEIDRTNPFFNEYGEQSYPIDIPCCETNSRILGYPEKIDNDKKVTAKLDMYIHDGSYSLPCRAAVLSARKNGSISITLYINNGSFYSRLESTSLRSVFAGETVSDVNTVPQAISFCKSLISGNNDKFGIFPVLIDEEKGEDNIFGKGRSSYRYINRLIFNEDYSDCEFYNASEREETVNDKKIILPQGFYISPFLKLSYILKRVFDSFGYALEDSIFNTSYLKNVVVINNVMDAIVNGVIKLEQLLPDRSCSDLFNLIRLKFCCEFIPDEINKTVKVVFFKDIPEMNITNDITGLVDNYYSIQYPGEYQRVVLKSESKIESDITPLDFSSLKQSYPILHFNNEGAIVSEGYAFVNNMFAFNTDALEYKKVYTKVAESSCDYDTGEQKSSYEIIIPESIPESRENLIVNSSQSNQVSDNYLFIGKSRALNSRIVLTDGSEDIATENNSVPFMLAYAIYDKSAVSMGSVFNKYTRHNASNINIKFSDYALNYNGIDGIFEKFWRKHDDILRNSKDLILADLLLKKENINNFSSYAPILLSGRKIVPDKLSYSLGGSDSLKESRFLSIDIKSPADTAPDFNSFFSDPSDSSYEWIPKMDVLTIKKSEYDASQYKNVSIINVYPPNPTYKDLGKKLFLQKTCVNYFVWGELAFWEKYALVTVWLEAQAKT